MGMVIQVNTPEEMCDLMCGNVLPTRKVVRTFRNKQNRHKYMEVVRYRCGHYYACQYIRYEPFESASGELTINYTGVVRNRKCRWRWKWANLKILLEDYEEVTL